MADHIADRPAAPPKAGLRTKSLTVLAVAATVTILAPATFAWSAIVGQWNMNEPAGSTLMLDSAAPAANSSPYSGVVDNGSTYLFPGWTNNLTPTGQLSGVLATSSLGEIRVPDPSGKLLPLTSSFSVAVRLRPTLVNGSLPTDGVDPALINPSYNVVQRGRATDPGGFYKLELIGYGSKYGKIHCGMKAPGYNSVDVYSGPLLDGNFHTVDCTIDRLAKVLRITTDGVVSWTKSYGSTYGSISPRDIYGTFLTVGKKPGSLNPADAFAGEIDWVSASR